MQIKQKLILCVFACSLVQPVFGATAIGARDCGEWTNRKKDKFAALSAQGWLGGYMCGLNAMHEYSGNKDNPLSKITSTDQIYLWMDNFCLKNPLANIADGGDALFIELMKKK